MCKCLKADGELTEQLVTIGLIEKFNNLMVMYGCVLTIQGVEVSLQLSKINRLKIQESAQNLYTLNSMG